MQKKLALASLKVKKKKTKFKVNFFKFATTIFMCKIERQKKCSHKPRESHRKKKQNSTNLSNRGDR